MQLCASFAPGLGLKIFDFGAHVENVQLDACMPKLVIFMKLDLNEDFTDEVRDFCTHGANTHSVRTAMQQRCTMQPHGFTVGDFRDGFVPGLEVKWLKIFTFELWHGEIGMREPHFL